MFDILGDSDGESSESICSVEEDKEIETKIECRPIGLFNEKYNCFMNSVVQAMMACCQFRQFLLEYPNVSKEKQPNMFCISSFLRDMHRFAGSPIDPFEFVVSKNKVKSRKNADFYPNYIRDLLSYFHEYNENNGRMGFDQQQDAQEFLQFLLDRLHEETLSKPSKSQETKEIWENVPKSKKKHIIQSDMKISDSPINDIFGGRFKVEIRKKGEKNSIIFEPFLSISLPLQSSHSHPFLNIQQAMTEFLSSQRLFGVCNSMNKRISAHKAISIEYLGSVVILHLKRFTYWNTLSKLDYFVEYTEQIVFPGIDQEYSLKAAIVHLGESPQMGHYFALCKYQTKWFKIDDQKIERIENPLNENVYVLFYESAA